MLHLLAWVLQISTFSSVPLSNVLRLMVLSFLFEFGQSVHVCLCMCSFRCLFALVTCDLLFIQNPKALSSKFATCLFVIFFLLQDVKLLHYLGISRLLAQPSVVFISLVLPRIFCFWEFFAHSQSVSL